jgi:hypothetical protein
MEIARMSLAGLGVTSAQMILSAFREAARMAVLQAEIARAMEQWR